MEKDVVVKLRDSLGKDNIRIVCDNEQLFVDGREGVFLLWDDDNEILFRVTTNNNYYQQNEKPIEVLGTSYENIQYIGKSLSLSEFDKAGKQLIAKNIFNDSELQESKKYFNDKYNKYNPQK